MKVRISSAFRPENSGPSFRVSCSFFVPRSVMAWSLDRTVNPISSKNSLKPSTISRFRCALRLLRTTCYVPNRLSCFLHKSSFSFGNQSVKFRVTAFKLPCDIPKILTICSLESLIAVPVSSFMLAGSSPWSSKTCMRSCLSNWPNVRSDSMVSAVAFDC